MCVSQVNLDGFALPIKKLKGTDPVESLDFSNKGLRPASAIVIASLIGDNASLTSIDVGSNGIIGDAAKELATVVLSKPTLEIFCSIPIKQLRADEVTELNLTGKGFGVPGAMVLTELLPASASITQVCQIRQVLVCGAE